MLQSDIHLKPLCKVVENEYLPFSCLVHLVCVFLYGLGIYMSCNKLLNPAFYTLATRWLRKN
jgi:hypothetical protein